MAPTDSLAPRHWEEEGVNHLGARAAPGGWIPRTVQSPVKERYRP